MKQKPLTRDIGLFALICIAYTWPILFAVDVWLVPTLKPVNITAAALTMLGGHMLAMLGPAIAAFCMWRFVHKVRPPAWNWSRLSYYGWASLAALLFWALPGGIGLLLGDSFETPILPYMWIGIAMMLFLGWFSGLGEEIGWCGYLMTRPVEQIGRTRAIIVSGIIRGVWHWPILFSPHLVKALAGEESILQLILVGVVVLIPLVCSNILMGAFFGWIWFRTQSLPLLGWTHQWYDLARDATITLLVGYGNSVWVNYLALPVFYMVCFTLLGRILREEGLTWRSLFGLAPKPGNVETPPTSI
jgi:membrane protease YdiL (CAAX protease family)